uniref:Uncharacterized protein n=1 Tax=viral metagenome TaxID=1070528 RepID=A0A6M3XNJ4_9ZZZZ
MGHTYLICRKSTHTDLIDTNGIPLHGCPYCEIDKLRGELAQVTKEREQAKMLSERFFEQRNKRNNDLVALRKELKNANRGAKKNHDVARLAVQEAITLRKALGSLSGIEAVSADGFRELTKDEAIAAAKNIIKSMSFSNEDGETLRVKEKA